MWDDDFFVVDRIPDGVDLAAALREFNSRELEVPWMWSLGYDIDVRDPKWAALMFGVRGEVGALYWAANAGTLVPVIGTNDEKVMYKMGGFYDSYVPVGSEVPVEKVYEVLSEFLVTHRLPECIEWQDSPL
jgi:hypothetical protein